GQSFFANPQSGECAWAVPSGTFVLPPQSGGQWWELYDEERDLRSASSSAGKRNGLPPPAPSASTKPHSGRGAGLSTIPSTNSLPIQSGSSRSDPGYEDSSADFPPPASFELRRIVRRERDPVKRKRMAALAAASSESNPPPPVPRLPTTRLSTGDHKVLPADLRREIEAFAIESYAKRHFAVHRSGILRRKTPLEKLLRWQKQPITSPLLALEDSETKKDAVRGFKVILRIMGDRITPVFWPKRWLLERGIASGSAFRDEIFIQTIKQLTSNPRFESRKSGWEWMCVLLVTFAPSRDLHGHLQSFIKGCASSGPEGPNSTSEEEVIMARYCLGRLANIARRGSRLQTPTIAEIECASEAAFHPGVFGQTLDVIMQRQADVYPEAKVPIVLTFLTDAMLAMDALKAPLVFRTPGDPDLMTKLRVRIEKGHYSLVGLVSQLDGDVSVLASLLKLWFRELEEPLFPPSIYYDCLEAAATPNQPESVKACLRIVQERLPKLNKRVVAFTVSFLQLFCTEQAKDITGLSVEMLAGVFAPNLFLCP
ncbi:Rho GTPase activation protein, partial [Acaromyces ingoldii]